MVTDLDVGYEQMREIIPSYCLFLFVCFLITCTSERMEMSSTEMGKSGWVEQGIFWERASNKS